LQACVRGPLGLALGDGLKDVRVRSDVSVQALAGRGAQPPQNALETGAPLTPDVRSRMESRLGHDFSSVRIHHRPEEAKALHARAFTVGEDVTFAPAQYAPGTPFGDRLLEHELGHVVDHRHSAPLGAYRAPEGEQIPAGPESPLQLPRPKPLNVGLGSLSLGLGTLDGFALNGYTLTTRHAEEIGTIAARLLALIAAQPGGRIAVTGHTDLVGDEAGNVELGRKRADAVVAGLVKAGVPRWRVDIDSAGESTPVVETEGQEPRNRRVEIRFAGEPIGSASEAPQLRLGPPERPPTYFEKYVSPVPGIASIPYGGADTAPRYQPSPTVSQAPSDRIFGPVDDAKVESKPRTGSPGDILKAAAATKEGQQAIDAAAAAAKKAGKAGLKEFGEMPMLQKVVVATLTGSVAAGILAGATAGLASDRDARNKALNLLDGTPIPVPGVPGVAIVPHTKDGFQGGTVTFDIVKILGGGGKK